MHWHIVIDINVNQPHLFGYVISHHNMCIDCMVFMCAGIMEHSTRISCLMEKWTNRQCEREIGNPSNPCGLWSIAMKVKNSPWNHLTVIILF